jgi:hypothetical protein
MSVVSWQDKLDATYGVLPIKSYHHGGVHYEDYRLACDIIWRYTWTNFTLNDHPQFVEVYNMTEQED